MKAKKLLKSAVLALLPVVSFAQQATVKGIKLREFQGVHEIRNHGFYTVYEEEKQKGKIRNYSLKFYDYAYHETGSENIELSKVAVVSSSDNNDSHLAIAFADQKLKRVKVKSFDMDGSLAGELDLTQSAYPGADVYRSPEGFVIVNKIMKSALSATVHFEIIGVDNKLNILWQKELNDEKVREVIDVVATEGGVAVAYTTGKGMNKENYDQHMMRLSHSGKVIFDEVFASNYYYFPNKILIEDDKLLVFGSYPAPGKSKAVGIFAISFSETGDIVAKKEISYQDNISPQIKSIKSESDINMKDEPQFIVNDVIKTPGGGYTLITETIALRPAVGVGVNVSTGGGTGGTVKINTAFIMGDFLVLNLKSSSFDLEAVKVVTKRANKVVFSGTVFNVNQYYSVLRQSNVSNYRFCIEGEKNKLMMVYTIRQSYLGNIQVGVADLSKSSKVVKSEVIDSDLEKAKDLNAFGVLRNIDSKVTVYTFRKGILSFYDMNY